MNDVIAEKLKLLPDLPGVYKMLDSGGTIIYVGKAVNLKNRVRQYFHSQKNMAPKVMAMVSHIADFEYILTASETEALTLEASLTKTLQPRYNILLKDDKHFPYVRLDEKQDFPRYEVVRRVKNDGARYFGPYLSAVALRDALACIRDSFPVRQCKKDIRKAIARRERPCLMYHLGKCCAPCSGNVTREEYHALLSSVSAFLEGKTGPVIAMLTERMEQAAQEMEFERAAQYRDRITAVRGLEGKQSAMCAGTAERDVFALVRDGEDSVVFALFVRGGSVIGSQCYSLSCADEPAGEIMAAFIQQFYSDSGAVPREITVLDMPEGADELEAWLTAVRGKKAVILCPRRGEKREQTLLAESNGREAIKKRRELEHRSWERGDGAMLRLVELIGLDVIPERMECYDNSHLRGRDTVSGMVVFLGGKPAPKEYRRFRIKAEADSDDILAMREVLTRRFERADKDEKFADLPDLIVVDGGRTQLGVALEVLDSYGLSHIPAIGLAESSEGIYLPGADEPMILGRGDGALHILERIRDEAHRFAITYHRSLRVKNALLSELDGIEGVGPKRKRLLFDAFVTRDDIAAADVDSLAAVKGMTRSAAEAVYAYFHPDGSNEEKKETEEK